MAVNNRQRLRDIDNTGFGANSSVEGGRILNPDGTANLRKRGIPFWERISIYHTLLRMKPAHFILMVFLFYTTVNLIFASGYFFIGVESLGVEQGGGLFEQFLEAFFFSSQTLTTVGYGHMAPRGIPANIVASTESLVGILSFAVVTGLIYGRFSRPRAYLLFSPSLLIAPYKEGKALMLRMATYKNNHLTDAEAGLTLALHVKENGKTVTKFYPLKLEIEKINSMALSWTLVHAINEDSPLYNYSKEDVAEARMELIVMVKAFDDHFSNMVQQRTSYTYQQVVYGAKFLPMFERGQSGGYTLLELNKINAHELVQLPETVQNTAV
ncbi:MAG: Inward rectifier potassium channel Irk [Flavipsychrobacter sp.]|jgi:inward rectifier potassium channel|nr:Inward rectifier potassium channel Irk [Flavipsychrobacter sp.]